VVDRPVLEGAAALSLVDGVVFLDPSAAVFTAMLDGWAAQQRTRFLKANTVADRIALVHRFASFTNEYAWQWTPAEVEAFFDALRSGPRPIVFSTARGYQTILRLFMEYVTDPRYGWPAVCRERFGESPAQILHAENSIVHAAEFEGQSHRRPLTYDEAQALFDAADESIEDIRARRRKGALAAVRDAALLKTVYAFGLRRNEACCLDFADLRHNPKVPEFGRFGGLFVRHGKSSRGSPPKRRTVLTVPEMDWIVPIFLIMYCSPIAGPSENHSQQIAASTRYSSRRTRA
jgi:integrase/recombinase XerD